MLPTTRALLIANVAVFGLQFLAPEAMDDLFALWPLEAGFAPWQLLTYAFLHGGFTHLTFNMIGLTSFGNELEDWWGGRRLLIFYFASVFTAALAQLAVTASMNDAAPTVGASGGIYGLLLGYAMMFPRRKVMPLIPPIPMPAWLFALIFAGLELFMGITGTASGIAHFAHLGGMVGGYFMMRHWRRAAQH